MVNMSNFENIITEFTTAPIIQLTSIISVDAYEKLYNDYISLRNNWNDFRISLFLVSYCFGVISSFLTLATFYRNKTFSDPCFACYQGCALSELVYQIIYIIFYSYKLNERKLTSNAWCWTINAMLDTTICNLSVNYTSILVIFLSIHRAIGCLLPQKYYLLDSRKLCLGVTIGTFLIFIPTAIPQAFAMQCSFDNKTLLYSSSSVNNDYKIYSNTLSWFRSVQGIAITVTSTLAVIGMVKTALFR